MCIKTGTWTRFTASVPLSYDEDGDNSAANDQQHRQDEPEVTGPEVTGPGVTGPDVLTRVSAVAVRALARHLLPLVPTHAHAAAAAALLRAGVHVQPLAPHCPRLRAGRAEGAGAFGKHTASFRLECRLVIKA